MVGEKLYPPPPLSTPRLAPWDHVEVLVQRLDRLIALLEGWPGLGQVISKLDEINSQLGDLEIKVTTPWGAKEPEEIFRLAIRTIGTFFSDKMVDWTEGKRLLLKVDSSLNQAVLIQLIGNIRSAKDEAVDINGVFPCVANGKITIGLAWDDWHPYVGCEITVAAAPTSGVLTITAVIQE